MKSPKISVVVPSYNYAAYLPECLRSIQSQTFQDFELIVVDDGSTDNTRQIVSAHEPLFNKNQLRYIYQANAGVAAARNAGIDAARGEYITFIDADDLWLPTYLEKQAAAVGGNPVAAICYTWYSHFDDQSRERYGGSVDFSNPSRATLSDLLLENTCAASGVITSVKRIKKLGGFDNRFSSAADWHMWLRLAASGRTEVVKEPLVLYRVHRRAMSGDSLKMNIERVRVFREISLAYRHCLSISPHTKRWHLAQLEYNVVIGHIHKRQWIPAIGRLFHAMAERPFWWRLYGQSLRCMVCLTAERLKRADSTRL